MSAKNRFRKRKWKSFLYEVCDQLLSERTYYRDRFEKLYKLPRLVRFYLTKKSIL